MAEFLEVIKQDPKIQNEKSQIIDQYNRKSISTGCQVGQKALVQSKAFKQAIKIMRERISGLDIELKQKGRKIQSLEGTIGIPDSKVVEEMNRLDLNKQPNKDKCDEIMKKFKKIKKKHSNTKKIKTMTFKQKFFALIRTFF